MGLCVLGSGILVQQTLVGPVSPTLVSAAIALCLGTPLAFRAEDFIRSRATADEAEQ